MGGTGDVGIDGFVDGDAAAEDVVMADLAGYGGVGVDDVLMSHGPVDTAGAAGVASVDGYIGRVDRDDVDGVGGGDDLGLAPVGQTFEVGDRVRDIYGSVGSVLIVDADGDLVVLFDDDPPAYDPPTRFRMDFVFVEKKRGL